MLIPSLDLDGTILNYGNHTTEIRFNPHLLEQLYTGPSIINGVRTPFRVAPPMYIGIATNQGRLMFGLSDPQRYPTPAKFAWRLNQAIHWLQKQKLFVIDVRVSVYHERASREAIEKAAREVRQQLALLQHNNLHTVVYTTRRSRKPSGTMLRAQDALLYAGDSDEDRDAAADAGIPFIRINRFM